MVKTCSVKGCNSKAGQGIKFHGLPKGDISKEWIKFLEKSNPSFKLTKTCTLCGLHFDSDLDYEITATSVYQTKQLKKNAVPSILNPTARRSLFCESNTASNYNAEEEVVTLSLLDASAEPFESLNCSMSSVTETLDTVIVSTEATEQNTVETISSTEKSSSDVSANKKRKCFVGDFKHINEIDTPNRRLQFWNASHATVENQRKRIKFLNKKNLLLTKRVKTLDDLVKHLKDEKKMISDNCFTVLKGTQ
ncbi:uncharacterized protein LOC111033545 isoform X2 [Myzus persicae]|uniref:uncharacterized protein LOC111033545 isoform X2 n=1 Tax=Myzus persicae TaxID=13164 RepID=UPI000B9397AD|nr:uncharacterized protein LOC111033545 isoform X2 [Myzus persicae]